ncbi:MAG: hypothetical protein WDN28_27385 [Chthoniobacter sp.]
MWPSIARDKLFAVDNNGVEQSNGSEFVSYIEAISGGGAYVLNVPSSVAFSSTGDTFVLDISGNSPGILRFTGSTFDTQVVDYSHIDFIPSELVVGPDDKLYVSGVDLDTGLGEVRDYNLDGTGEAVLVSGLNNPTYMAFAAPEPSTLSPAVLRCRPRRHGEFPLPPGGRIAILRPVHPSPRAESCRRLLRHPHRAHRPRTATLGVGCWALECWMFLPTRA